MGIIRISNPLINKIVFVLFLVLCTTPIIDPPFALLIGFIFAQLFNHPYKSYNSKVTQWLLKFSVVGLGFGMNFHHAIQAGKDGIMLTVFSIASTFLVAWLIGKWLKVDGKTSYLMATGTAICGGSAIAAVAPIIKADEKQMSVSLGTVFILNSVALFIFPVIGHLLNLSQHQFGIWAAIAIHDTSSVVGAAAKYGQEALQVATTVKLERALWIIPLSIITAVIYKSDNSRIKIPYFIGFFIVAMIISTYFADFQKTYDIVVVFGRKGLTLTLFLIGSGLSLNSIKSVGIKPLLQAVMIWVFISLLSIAVILMAG
ncbi:MAG: putative sulfate exporter family transporter [Ignavibacteriae bacterium]|nr:putative sulfate exporter family transporter [Ignavibacteriota bacterium]